MSLERLFAPRSVAIVGASDRSYYARSVFENLGRLGFPLDQVVLVNPNRAAAFGRPCVPRLEAPVDLAVVATPTASVPAVIRECGVAGVGACVVLSDGFAEAGPAGAALQAEAAAAARGGGVVLCGPNTMGLVVPAARLGAWGGALPAVQEGGIAAILQSSGLLNLLFNLFAYRRLGLRLGLSVGNEAGLTLAEALGYAVDDDRTAVVALFVESVADPAAFRAALAHAAARRTPVVVLHAGRSEAARRNVLAHTGRLAAASEAWDALLAQHGAIAVGNIDELVETVALFARVRATPVGDGAGLLTISGGDCTLLGDLAARVGLPLPEPAGRAELAAIVGKPASRANPLDVENLWRSDTEAFFRAVERFCAERFALTAFRLNLPDDPERMRGAYARVREIARAAGTLPVFLSRASEPLAPAWHELFATLEVPFLQEYERALRALAALLAHSRRAAPVTRLPVARGHRLPPGEGPLAFEETLALLAAYGIPFAPSRRVTTAAEAVAAAAEVGYPVALKAWTAHKTDRDALRLELADAGAVREAFATLGGRAPGAPRIVQRMERGVVECIAGLSWDPQLGPVVLVGLGGVLAEALHDVALRVAPIAEADAQAMLDALRGRALLAGPRGRPSADVAALVDLLVRLSDLAVEQGGRLAALDLNPVIVRAQSEGVVAVDALVLRSAAVAARSSAPLAGSTTTA